MEAYIEKMGVGDTLGVAIPDAALERAGLRVGDRLAVYVDGHDIILRRVTDDTLRQREDVQKLIDRLEPVLRQLPDD